MKKLLSLSIMLLLIISSTTFASSDDKFGHEGVDALNPDVEEMLIFALEDEVLAYTTYEKIVEFFDVTRPFTNIMKAELKHQEAIKTLMATYNIEIPEVDPSSHIVLPTTLDEAYQAGVQAEIDNIALYEAFVKTDIREDIKTVFENLIAGSENHQASFERQLERNSDVINNNRSGNNDENNNRRGR